MIGWTTQATSITKRVKSGKKTRRFPKSLGSSTFISFRAQYANAAIVVVKIVVRVTLSQAPFSCLRDLC